MQIGKNMSYLIMSLIALIVVAAVFATIWNPATGDGLYDYGVVLVNDSDFVANWGSGLADLGIKVLAASPFLIGITLFGTTLYHGYKVFAPK